MGAAVPAENLFAAASTAPAGAVPGPQLVTTPATTSGGSAMRIILIALAIILGLGILGAGVAAYAIYKVREAFHSSMVQDGRGNVTNLNTHFGAVNSNGKMTVRTPSGAIQISDPFAVAQQMGVEVYPGSQPDVAATIAVDGASSQPKAGFLSNDPVVNIVSFYRTRYPKSTATQQDASHQQIAISMGGRQIVVTAAGDPAVTRYQIAEAAP
jgi:hypothetical protein